MFPRAYAWLMSQQLVHVTRAIAAGNPACHVILGVPTYDNRRKRMAHLRKVLAEEIDASCLALKNLGS